MESITLFIEDKLKLKINKGKSKVDRPWRRKFLGFSFYWARYTAKLRVSTQASIKRSYKYIATFLLFCFFFSVIQMPAKAASDLNQTSEKSSIKADIGEIPNKLPKSKLELTSKRTKYSTRYLNPDGSFTEEIFLEPQFYQDSTDKKWNDYL